jgi:hypothetical protein
VKRKEQQLDLFGSKPKSTAATSARNTPVAMQPKRAERIEGRTTELFDDFELQPTVSTRR